MPEDVTIEQVRQSVFPMAKEMARYIERFQVNNRDILDTLNSDSAILLQKLDVEVASTWARALFVLGQLKNQQNDAYLLNKAKPGLRAGSVMSDELASSTAEAEVALFCGISRREVAYLCDAFQAYANTIARKLRENRA